MSEIEVHIDVRGRACRVGTLRVQTGSRRTSATLEPDDAWRVVPGRISLAPALRLGDGARGAGDPPNPLGAIGDSAPDAWGRRLMRRLERHTAEKEGRAVRTPMETDFLLGVADVTRAGALRFRHVSEAEFRTPLRLDEAAPPLAALPRLLAAVERVSRDEEDDADVRALVACGSSLGGARPKVSVVEPGGRLAIAKLPREGDGHEVGAWEAVALTLAERAGIHTARHRLVRVAGKAVLLSVRFDRTQEGQRVPFLSAQGMLGVNEARPGSYPDLVDAVRGHGANLRADVPQLFRRMVFNILSSNLDDHLRNHGFLWDGPEGWRLSPAYDLNPVPADDRARILATNISEDEGTCSVDLAREAAAFFALSLPEADALIHEVATAVATWRDVARSNGIASSDIERMEGAFEHDDARIARAARAARVPTRQRR